MHNGLFFCFFCVHKICHNIQPTLPSCPSTLCEHRSFNVSGNSHSSMWQLLSHLICGALLGFIALKDYLFGMSGVWPEMDECYFRIFFQYLTTTQKRNDWLDGRQEDLSSIECIVGLQLTISKQKFPVPIRDGSRPSQHLPCKFATATNHNLHPLPTVQLVGHRQPVIHSSAGHRVPMCQESNLFFPCYNGAAFKWARMKGCCF